MSLKRYSPIKESRGTVIPKDVRAEVMARDGGRCVCIRAEFPTEVVLRCGGDIGLDHVRGSGALGLKSRSTVDNLVVLSAWCHRWKTEHGRTARPLLLDYIDRATDPHSRCVDPCSSLCPSGVTFAGGGA